MVMEDLQDLYELTPAQQGILFHALYEENMGVYLNQICFTLRGEVDLPVYQQAWRTAIDKFSVLRTAFMWEELQQPLQIVWQRADLPWHEEDWRSYSSAQQEKKWQQLMQEDRRRGFSLDRPPLMRISIIRMDEEQYQVLWTFHHLILDGWSFSLLLQETCYYYQQLLQQQCVEEIPEQSFRDYVAWIQQQDQASAERFWKERLATVTEPTFLPVQPNRYLSESQPSMLFATFEEWLDEEWTKQLEEVARRHQLTLNTWIQGAWALLLNRYTSQEQVLFGTTVSGRPVDLDRFESMIGMFINTLPSLVRVEPGKTVLDWLKELQQQQAEAREYEYTSLVDIQSWSQLPQGTSMFESLIAFENYPLEQFHAGNVRIEGLYAVERTNFPFNLLVVPGRRMLFKWSWDRSKFADSAIRRLISHFVHLLQQMIKNPTGLHLEQIQLLYPDELRQFHEWDGEKLPYSQHSMLHHLIEEQVDQAPDQIALIDQAHQITYQELDERANRVAGQLLSSGVLPEERVGICLHRSIDMVVAILGVLKAGAAYVPLDPAYPEERVRYMLEDSAAVVLLTEKSLLNRFSDLELEQYCLDDEMLWLNIPSVRPRLELNPEQLAYIIYTSGSTGKPKGVMIEHRNAVSFISWAHQVFSQQELGGVLAATSICFDLSVFELFAPLSCGGKVIIADDILQLPQLKGRELVTLLNTVPSAMAELLRMEVIPPQVMTVNLAGEPLPTDIVRQLYERESIQHVYNLYGPSEDTTYSTFYLVPKGRELAPAIGRSIANSSAYVLDQYQQLLPIGVPGELYLGGHGVARGYRNQPQLTKEKFIIHSEFGRLYRTGDLVRWNEDGQLEFLGRIDHQVKIRGYRIECGEIEALLRQHEAIHDVVVVARNDVGIGQQLVAYLTGEDHLVDWTEYLRQYIPDYMVPAFFVTLDELPLTPNGKVDRKALPKPQQQGSYSQEELTTVEQLIRDIWKTVLPISPQGKQSHFFQLGGHSLLATRVVARMNEVFQLKMPLRVLFEAPTIEQLAMAVESEMRTAEKTALPTVERVDCSKPIPASFAQQRIWFFERFIPGTSVYQIPYALELNGKLDVAVLASSCQMLTNRHGSLRTTFVEQDGELFQKINEEITLPLTMTDLRVTSDPEIATLQAIQQEMEQGFSLEQGPLFRLHLFRTGEQSWIFFVLFHHIIADGWSLNVFKKELFSIYQDLLVGKEPAIQEEEWQYTDFAVWQRKLSSTGAWQQQLDYWKQKLANTPVLQLPLDHPRSAEQTFTGASFDLSIPNAWIGQLEKLGRTEGATLFMILLAAFQVLLARLSGQNQFAIGSPIANRSQVWMEKCIGFFVNTQVYRTNLSFDWDFRELVAQVRKTALEAYEHQDVPFEQIVDELQPERSLTYSPLFQVMFALQEQNQSFESISNLKVSTFSIPQTTAKFDLSLIVTEEDGEWRGIFEYNSDLFTVETIERMSRLYRQLLQEIIQNPNQSIGKYSFLQPFEQRQLQQWNQTTVPILESNLLAPLWDRVCQHPEAEAIVSGEERWSYQRLHERAEQWAKHLVQAGVQEGDRVAVWLHRSAEQIAALWGIWKAGATYLPLDRAYPQQRIEAICADAQVKGIICEKGEEHPSITQWTAEQLDAPTFEEVALPAFPNGEASAYLIYTSGSTGQPKGVEVSHRALCNLVQWHRRTYEVNKEDRMSWLAGVAFDASVWEIWPALVSGATLYLPTEEERLDPAMLQAFYLRSRITISFVPTPLLEQLLRMDWSDTGKLRVLLTGGDAMHHAPPPGFPIPVINHYGPTENTVVATAAEIPAGSQEVPAIGRPIANVTVHVLDEQQQAVPIGIPGELYLGGESLAKGYYGQPEQTAERWIEHPQWGRLYRTGDRVRYRWDGELEFLGRFDHQISLRGFRIELGEIEACLLRHPQIQEAVVEVWEERLVAYLVGDTVEGEAMRQWVKQRLPEYMVPRFYEWLPALPITPNGKVDRKALPEPAWEGEVTFVAARNEIEARLVHIWQEILQQPQIGIQDNFFACGGDSILSIQVVARAQREGLRLTPKQLFEHQTIAELAPYVQQQPQVAAEQGLVEGTVPFSPIQQWFWEQAIPNRNHWNQSLLLLWKETAIPDALQAALQAVIEQHDALRLRIVEEESVHQSIEAELPFTWVDLRGQPEEWQQQRIEQIADQAQQQLDLTKGPIQRMIYFQLGDQPDRLLWILHHWMVDAVSWRILLEDFQQAYQQATQQQPIQLPAKTSSWKDWIAQLQQYAQTQQVQKELPYWKQQVESITALPVDHPEGENRQAHLQMKVRTFTKEQTEALLRESTKAYRTQVTDLLLTAWAQTVQKWTASDICHLHLEGHGREEISEQLDLSRTVGWFTSLYPLKLDISEAETMGDAIKGVKEQIRAIPHKGLGYGLLQAWGKESSLTTAPKPEVSFNYLGQVDGTWSGDLLLGMAPEARGEMVDPTSERAHRIDLLGMVVAGRFQLTLQYSEQQYEQQTMDWLIQTYMEQLQQLITHCCSAEAGGYTPSDFPLAKIDQEVLDQLTEKYPAIEQIYPLAPLQEGMLFQSMYSKNDQVGGDYIVQMVFTLKGELNQQAWEEAWHDVVQRFAVFRTAYLWEGVQQPLQLVVPNVTYAFEKQDWRIFTSVEIERNWHQLVQSDRKQGFQLDQPGLTRLHFIQIDEDHYRLLWTYHHLLLDGWSMSLVLNQVWKNYLRRADGASIEIEKEVPYERYLNWLQNQNQEAAKTYWQKKLSSKETTTWISSAPASNQARATDVKINRLSKEMTDRLQQFARQHKLTISTVLQAAWSLLLGTYSGEEYVRYGIAVAGRPPTLEHVEKIVGLFINTLPVSCRFNGEIDLLTLCRKIQQEQLEMRQHEHCSLIDIQGWSGIPRNQSLIHHLFAYENYLEMDRLEQPHLQIKEIQGLEQTEYSLCLVTAPGDELFVKWMYDRQYFHATEIEQLHQHWVSLLEQFTSSPTQTIESLTIIDPEQQEDQLTGDHLDVTDQSTKLPYRLVEQIAENHPNVIALRTQDRVYSYRQLNEAANRLAHFLRKEGVRAETKVVLYLERSCELVIGQLAVHKAGGIFIPVDPNHPIRRLHEVITDAQATWLLTQKRFDESVQSLDVQTLVLDEAEEAWGKESSENLSTDVDEDQLAYLIYTSGSTGRPKGVEITHKALFNLVHWHQERYQMDTKDRMSFIAGVGFDASIWEIWPTLASGSSLHIPEEDVRIQPELLQEWLLNEAITYSFLPTPLMEQMFSLSWGSAGSLRAFLTGGDQLRQYPKSTFPIPVVNHYGPTENTVVTTAVALTPIGEEQMTTLPPIGQAIANVKLYVLNQHQQPVPQGVKGELYIGGASLARGYHGQPEMTAERFVHHPIYGRLFRTGDQVRLAANGNLEFLGRLDQQVKIRGMRMELGEIEARLSQLPEIKECVVTVHDDQLIAYAVLSSDQSFAWQQELRKQLPTYMIPQQLISLEKIPLTPNGKIDRQALPKPEKMDSEKYVAPRTPMERKMAEIWSEVLQKDKIGLHDHFFLLGGHSLLATQAVTRMNEVFRQEIPLKYLFENPTIAQLVEQIKQDLFAKLTTS